MIYLGYTLSDNSVGVLYNDSTRIVLHQNGEQLTYLDKEYVETVCRKTDYPSELKKKVSLIEYFRKYMTEHLLKVRILNYCENMLIKLQYSSSVMHIGFPLVLSNGHNSKAHA